MHPPSKASTLLFHVISRCALVCVSSAGLGLKGVGWTQIYCRSERVEYSSTNPSKKVRCGAAGNNDLFPVVWCTARFNMQNEAVSREGLEEVITRVLSLWKVR